MMLLLHHSPPAQVLADDRVSGFFKGVDMNKQRSKQMQFMMFAFGGPNEYKVGATHCTPPAADTCFISPKQHVRCACVGSGGCCACVTLTG